MIDVANHPSWQAAIESAILSPDGPVAVGSIYTYSTKVMGRSMETKMEVSQFEENKLWAVKTVGVPTAIETIYTFTPEGDGTKLEIAMDLVPGSFPAAAEAMMKKSTQDNLDAQCATIKSSLE